jgi:lysozyme family protein
MDYNQSYADFIVNPDRVNDVERIVAKIKANQSHYEDVSKTTTVPWYVIAAIHYRESGLSFTRHLHNGDPLTNRTVHVPKGRPIIGTPPFTWDDSAIDALNMSWLSKVADWSIGNTLALIERYNGLGYKRKGLPSPYIWAWSNLYTNGKYVADGQYDPHAIDQQCGAAIIIKQLI